MKMKSSDGVNVGRQKCLEKAKIVKLIITVPETDTGV